MVPSQLHSTGPNHPHVGASRHRVNVDAAGVDMDSILR